MGLALVTKNQRLRTKSFMDFVAALWSGRQSGGDLSPNSDTTKFDIAACKAMVDGIYVAANASTAVVLTGLTPTAVTSSAQYQKVLVTLKQAGTYGVYTGAKAASQALALLPEVPAGEVYIAHLELPVSFTAGSTAIDVAYCKQDDAPAATLGQF